MSYHDHRDYMKEYMEQKRWHAINSQQIHSDFFNKKAFVLHFKRETQRLQERSHFETGIVASPCPSPICALKTK